MEEPKQFPNLDENSSLEDILGATDIALSVMCQSLNELGASFFVIEELYKLNNDMSDCVADSITSLIETQIFVQENISELKKPTITPGIKIVDKLGGTDE